MRLVLTPDFLPSSGKSVGPKVFQEIDLARLAPKMEKDFFSVAGVAPPTADEIAKTICNVQPMAPNVFTNALEALDEVAVQGKPSLMKIYTDEMWPPHKNTYDGSPIASISDMELVFEDLVKATRHFIETTMGLSAEEVDVCASTSIVVLHLEKQIVRAINECVIPLVAVQTKMSPFDTNLLATAIKLRACYKTDWNLPWEEFVDKLHGVVKCDEENNSPKDVEQGKVNAGVTLPINHVELGFIIGSDGAEIFNEAKDNQPVPCDPPEPGKPLAVTKVPATDEHGAKVGQPAPGWWLGDDLCWHPPLTKDQEAYAFDLVTALHHPSAMVEAMAIKGTGELVTDRPKDPILFAPYLSPYLPLYTTPPIIPVDLQKKMGVSVSGHGTIGPGGEVEDYKFDGAWPIGCNPLAKSAPCAPTLIADSALGFKAGDVWFNSSNGFLYKCASPTLGAAVWCVIGNVTPTPEDPKIILSDKPQHLTDLENQMIEGMKEQLKLGGPVEPVYTDVSVHELQEHWSPEAEKDLQQAMVEEIKKQIDSDIIAQAPVVGFQMPGAPPNTVVMQPVVPLGQVDKIGGVFQKVPDSIAGMSDMAAMQAAMDQAVKIPKHLLHGKVQDTK